MAAEHKVVNRHESRYNFGADMTNMFGGAHAHPPDRDSLHEPGLRVVENITKKVRRFTVALLDETTRPTDPAKIRIDLDGVPGYSQASEHKDLWELERLLRTYGIRQKMATMWLR